MADGILASSATPAKSLMQRRFIFLVVSALCFIFFLLAARQASLSPSYSDTVPNWAKPGHNHALESNKVAALMETRATPNLVPIVLHFSSVLGPSWGIKIFTTAAVEAKLRTSTPLLRKIEDGTVQFVMLPQDASFKEHSAVSAFLTKPWFWEQLLPAEKVLMFQPDSILCSNSARTVDDFVEYDFVGAPVRDGLGAGYNGGLSIRNVPLILSILKEGGNWAEDRAQNKDLFHKTNIDYEDQWFYAKMEKRGGKFPGVEIAGQFAVETIWHDEPLGYHQANVWQAGNMTEILEWCPEYRMCTTETYKNH